MPTVPTMSIGVKVYRAATSKVPSSMGSMKSAKTAKRMPTIMPLDTSTSPRRRAISQPTSDPVVTSATSGPRVRPPMSDTRIAPITAG